MKEEKESGKGDLLKSHFVMGYIEVYGKVGMSLLNAAGIWT